VNYVTHIKSFITLSDENPFKLVLSKFIDYETNMLLATQTPMNWNGVEIREAKIISNNMRVPCRPDRRASDNKKKLFTDEKNENRLPEP